MPAEDVPLDSAVGRVLAAGLKATTDLPPFNNSAMDGYAVRAADLSGASAEKPVELREKETVRAGGTARKEVGPGETIKIMTGAPLPAGADAVVMVEMARPAGDGRVRFLSSPKAGDHIRRAGEDVMSGELLLKEGTFIRPYEVALLASQGIIVVPAIRRPRVAVLSTGDELVEAEKPLSPGRIRDSNSRALAAALSRWGAEVIRGGIVPDDAAEIERRARDLLDEVDVLLVSGGVSVGEFDLCKDVLEKIGVREVFWKVAIKPGKPLYFGVHGGFKLVFGVPGNPVSALVCLEEFVRPALERLQGRGTVHASFHLEGRAGNDYPGAGERQQYVFCNVTREGDDCILAIIRPQGSAMMGMACRADALAVSPAGRGPIRRGDALMFRRLK